MSKTVADYPELVLQWHPTKNGELKPNNLSFGSRKKIWWKCPVGEDHVWEAFVYARTNANMKSNCPCCAGRQVAQSNCLATVYPELVAQWHPIKNGNLTPYNITAGTHKKVWWKCPVAEDHEWEASVSKRTSTERSRGCACCRGFKVVQSNCLATVHPELTAQWHPTKNGNLTSYGIIWGSHKKVWWKCEKGHEWKTSPNHRNRGRGCPICRESNGEKVVAKILINNNIPFIRQWKHKSCKNKKMLVFDFALKCNKLKIIEYQGEQHYKPIGFGGDPQKNFERVIENDNVKKKWCAENNIPLLEIPYWEEKIEQTIVNFIKNY